MRDRLLFSKGMFSNVARRCSRGILVSRIESELSSFVISCSWKRHFLDRPAIVDFSWVHHWCIPLVPSPLKILRISCHEIRRWEKWTDWNWVRLFAVLMVALVVAASFPNACSYPFVRGFYNAAGETFSCVIGLLIIGFFPHRLLWRRSFPSVINLWHVGQMGKLSPVISRRCHLFMIIVV